MEHSRFNNSFFKSVASYNTNIATRYDTVLIVNSYVNSDSYVPLMSMRCWYFGEKKHFTTGAYCLENATYAIS